MFRDLLSVEVTLKTHHDLQDLAIEDTSIHAARSVLSRRCTVKLDCRLSAIQASWELAEPKEGTVVFTLCHDTKPSTHRL